MTMTMTMIREEDLYQVDGTTDVQTPNDNSYDNEDNEPDNTAGKRQRKPQLIPLEKK